MTAIERTDFNGLPALRLQGPDGATATVLEHGAHIVSWQPQGGGERLYLSPASSRGAGAAIRGGVPVVFPQFNVRGPLPKHGFARTRAWQVTHTNAGRSDALAVLRLGDDAQTRALWPHPFAAELTLCVGGDRLDIELEVENTGTDPLQFTAALHTYLAVAELETIRLEGLRGCSYEDFANGSVMRVDEAPGLVFGAEVDRIYFDAPALLRLREPHRSLEIEQVGFADTVVWNPWVDRAAALPDLPDADFRRFVCVEAAQIGRPVQLAPGEEWTGRQSLIAA
jgi:glucose-6-phosphate 1-epimerase